MLHPSRKPQILMLHPTEFVTILFTLSYRAYIRLELDVGIPTLIWLLFPFLVPIRFAVRPHAKDLMSARNMRRAWFQWRRFINVKIECRGLIIVLIAQYHVTYLIISCFQIDVIHRQ